jgi:hypothetical protein
MAKGNTKLIKIGRRLCQNQLLRWAAIIGFIFLIAGYLAFFFIFFSSVFCTRLTLKLVVMAWGFCAKSVACYLYMDRDL